MVFEVSSIQLPLLRKICSTFLFVVFEVSENPVSNIRHLLILISPHRLQSEVQQLGRYLRGMTTVRKTLRDNEMNCNTRRASSVNIGICRGQCSSWASPGENFQSSAHMVVDELGLILLITWINFHKLNFCVS